MAEPDPSDVPPRRHVRPSEDAVPDEAWLAWARELQAIAQAGLYYTTDTFDRERFERVRELACDCMGQLSGEPIERIEGLFANEDGYQTPKMDTRAAIPDEEGRLCLVHERGGEWSLPGGWVDQGQTIRSNTVKEAREEAGLAVEPVRLVAIDEHNLHNPHVSAWGIMKHFVLCRNLGGQFVPNDETYERGFFSRDELPPLFLSKNTPDQVALCFDCLDAWRAGKPWDPRFD